MSKVRIGGKQVAAASLGGDLACRNLFHCTLLQCIILISHEMYNIKALMCIRKHKKTQQIINTTDTMYRSYKLSGNYKHSISVIHECNCLEMYRKSYKCLRSKYYIP